MLREAGKLALVGGTAILMTGIVGCTVDVYSPPPPREVVVEEAPPPPPPGPVVEEEVVVDAPPPVVYEEPPPPPEVGVVWVQGEWIRVGGQWSWTHGHYDRAPRGRVRWIPGRWEHGPHGYVQVRGHWE